MTILFLILASTFLISFISFSGALTLFLKEKLLNKVLLFLVAFSAGSSLGGAFLHLIPEAILKSGFKENSIFKIFLYTLLGFCAFFILESFIRWHHHHATEHPEIMPFSYLILISDGVHNFIDGLVVAVSFAASLQIGTITALAVALHEIPQEIGDFGILVYGGFKKTKALILNFISALTIVFGGLLGFFLSERIVGSVVFFLSFAAGNFIYIACSDLIPEIKSREDFLKSVAYFLTFLAGIGLMIVLRLWD